MGIKKKERRKKVKSKTNTDENITWTVGLTLMSTLTFSSPKKNLTFKLFLKKKKNREREQWIELS